MINLISQQTGMFQTEEQAKEQCQQLQILIKPLECLTGTFIGIL